MSNFNLRASIAMVMTAAVLTACGGGGGSRAAATTDVPASAQQSSAGLLAYISELIGMTSETSEPILVGDAVLPVDDTTETSN